MEHKIDDSGLHTFDRDTARNLHLGYIERRWEIVAAVAWREYVAHGRGGPLFTTSADPGGEWDCIYLPLDLIEGDPLVKEYSNLLRSYDPTKQIIALFLTAPDCVNAYCGGLTAERVAPPDAYKRIRALLNSN